MYYFLLVLLIAICFEETLLPDQENGITSSKINLSGLGALEADHHAVERQQTRPLRALHAKRGKKEAEQACNKLNLGNLN